MPRTTPTAPTTPTTPDSAAAHSTRRDFLRFSLAAGAALGIAGVAPAARAARRQRRGENLRFLILGGTGFLGPHIVEAARARGHTLTLFNRGKTNPHLFPEIEKLRGDRNGDLKALEGREWDVVVDTSCYVPRQVRDSAGLLKDNVRQYILISTLSVYNENAEAGMDESAPVAKLRDETDEDYRDPEKYGPLKALCEKAADETMPGRVTNIRPALIVGPRDFSDRFTYWPVRIDKGGEVLAPGDPTDPIQFIDSRDLGEWIVLTGEKNTTGVFNAAGPDRVLTIGDLLATCKEVTASDASFTWADAKFLEEQNVSAWGDMPVWVPPAGESAGFHRRSNKKAIAAGLTFRTLAVTCKDTLDWFKSQTPERQARPRAGISADREKAVLAAWHSRKGSSPG